MIEKRKVISRQKLFTKELQTEKEVGGLTSIRKKRGIGSRKRKMRSIHLQKI